MKPTPLTDKFIEGNRSFLEDGMDEAVREFAGPLERLLGEARDAFVLIARNPGCFDDTGFTSGHVSRDLLARIDATLDPNCLEGPPRTREERIADARALDEVAPTPAEKFALMFLETPNPDYVDAPMQVSMTTIDPATGEVKQGVAESEGELRTFFTTDEEPLPHIPGEDTPWAPPGNPDCESCQ